MACGLSGLTDNQYVSALSEHVGLVYCCILHEHPQWHCDRSEKHCWAAKSPPKETQQRY